jgi:uncharacterized protein YbjT (DUF2867 family)
LQAAGLDLTIFRPSVIFGRGDSFLTLFARMAKIAPFFPLAGADARFQPVWVEDVAATVADSLENSPEHRRGLRSVRADAVCAGRAGALRHGGSGHPRAVIGIPDSSAGCRPGPWSSFPTGR